MSVKKLWTEIKKIMEKGRGYELKEMLEDKKDSIEAIFQKKGKKTYVALSNKKISVQRVRRVISKMQEYGCNDAILATTRDATPQARKEASEHRIDIIDSKHPLIYIFDHWLVPQHRLLSEEETKKVLEKHAGGDRSVAMRTFPKILTSDPAVRILNARPGQIIEIRRVVPPLEELIRRYGEHSGKKIYKILKRLIPAGEEIYYRIVVEE